MSNVVSLVERSDVSVDMRTMLHRVESGEFGVVNAYVLILQADIGCAIQAGGDADVYKTLYLLEVAKAEVIG